MQEQFNEQNSLALIQSMINKAKNNFSESGTLYLVWGIVVFICSIIQFVGVNILQNDKFYMVWFMTWAVVIYQLFFLKRKRKTETVKTYTNDILKYVWICFVIAMFLIIFILQVNKAYNSINPAILVLYGIPTFLSGMILKFRLLSIGGICCWLLACAVMFVNFQYQVLFIAAAVLVAWIVPGIYLRKKYLQENLTYGS